MPANQGNTPANWSPKPDFQLKHDITHCAFVPTTQLELEGWLDDTGALPDAEVYRDLDEAVFRDVILGAAERIMLDLRGDFYTVSEATEMHLQRQAAEGLGFYAVAIRDGRRDVATSVDLIA